MTMNCPNPPNRYNPADEPLWLVVERDDRSNCFEFPPHAHKAIVVGSCSNSDVRISGAAPVAFFLEREGTSIWLTPAYADAELRLDTLKVVGRRRIYTHGLVELANIELRLKVRDTPPTLRGDGLVRIDSEVSDPMSKRAAAAIDDLTATTMPPAGPIPNMTSATRTIGVDAFNFDGWFDDAIGEGSSASVDTQPLKPVPMPTTSESGLPTTTLKSARPPRPRIGPRNIKTKEMAPIQWPREPGGIVEAPSTPKVVVTEPKIDPYRTIEIAPIRLPEATPQSTAGRPKFETLRQAATFQIGCVGPASETTDFDVPVVKPTVKQPVANGVSSLVGSGGDPPGPQARRPTIADVSASAPNESCGSNPWFQEHAPARPGSTLCPSKLDRRLPSPSVALEKLGLLAKRQPALVFGGGALGSLVLVLFFAGAAKMFSPHSGQKSERVAAARPAMTGAGIRSESSKVPTGEPAPETATAPSGVAQPSITKEAKPEGVPAAIAATPDVAPAVGHLFAGRLPEAEQAYRDLATRFPGEPAFQSASRILARKNSPNCRGASPSKTACPSVKP